MRKLSDASNTLIGASSSVIAWLLVAGGRRTCRAIEGPKSHNNRHFPCEQHMTIRAAISIAAGGDIHL